MKRVLRAKTGPTANLVFIMSFCLRFKAIIKRSNNVLSNETEFEISRERGIDVLTELWHSQFRHCDGIPHSRRRTLVYRLGDELIFDTFCYLSSAT